MIKRLSVEEEKEENFHNGASKKEKGRKRSGWCINIYILYAYETHNMPSSSSIAYYHCLGWQPHIHL